MVFWVDTGSRSSFGSASMRLARFNRHVEMLTRRFKSGKYETFAPSGPGLVTKDDVRNARDLAVALRVNAAAAPVLHTHDDLADPSPDRLSFPYDPSAGRRHLSHAADGNPG